ncbi:bifunctional DNA primase/polymerase [Acidocella sp. KAb 2-4]|uniref:bifunctional DNA primase/polymerase n=1 Tax=Acidocella sp. KAb 2-4 TaxID=2885158 RepID=UPI001D066779|nr:bifunctional DNA primase/polymerase [Acidocella sp. KAb 2-4]MCB5945195.1 bifunctional DNA primase/polymerase [Acidocella sp. KAb 2-4]
MIKIPPSITLGCAQPDEACVAAKPVGAFVRQAAAALAHGFAVIPCGGADGKLPLVKWSGIKRPQSEVWLQKLVLRPDLQTANLGIISGASGVTVIDCDTPGRRAALEARFGETPIVVATPRGGLHLYYSSEGERCGRFEFDGIQGDIKAEGGFVVAPPSMRQFEGGGVGSYEFVEGSWAWREALPPLKKGALEGISGKAELRDYNPGTVEVGWRNTSLFDALRQDAMAIHSETALFERAKMINAGFAVPLRDAEIRRTVQSVWRYKAEGRLFSSERPGIAIPTEVYTQLRQIPGGTDAFMLLADLTANHAARASRGEDFVIVPEALEAAGRMFGWGTKRYRNAIQTLLQTGLVKHTHVGGKRRGDPHRYTFGPWAI